MPGHDQHRRGDGASRAREVHDVPVAQPEPACGRGRDVRRVLPGELRDGIRKLLEPGVLVGAAVPELVVGDEAHLEPRRAAQRLERRRDPRRVRSADRGLLPRRLGDDSSGEPLLPAPLERVGRTRPVRVHRARGGLRARGGRRRRREAAARAPAVLHETVRALLALGHEGGEELHLGGARDERHDERLDDGRRAVARPQVAPGLEGMGGRDPPGRGPDGLVVAQRVDDGVLRLGEESSQVEVGRRGVERVPRGDDERVDLPRLELLGERAQPLRACVRVEQRRNHVAHGLADVPERRVHRRGERVHGRGLPSAGDDERTTAGPREVLRHRDGERAPLPGRRRPERRQRAEAVAARQLCRDRAGEPRHLAGAHPQPVVRHAARDGEPGLRHVQPVHLPRHAPGGELPGLPQRVALARQQVALEREDHVRVGEREHRLEGAPERERRAGTGLVRLRGPRIEAGAREARQDPAAEVGERRRRGRLDEEAEPRALVLVVAGRERVNLLEQPGEGQLARALPEPGEAGRVVQVEDRRLADRVRAAPARRMGGVPLDLRGAPLP